MQDGLTFYSHPGRAITTIRVYDPQSNFNTEFA